MPKIVRVSALKDFTYQGREIKAGHDVDMVAIEAAAAGRAGNVSLTSVYRRRDMMAAPVSPLVMTTHPVPTTPAATTPADMTPHPMVPSAEPPSVDVEQPKRRGRPRKVIEDVTAGVKVTDEQAQPEPTPQPVVVEPDPAPVVQGDPIDDDHHES